MALLEFNCNSKGTLFYHQPRVQIIEGLEVIDAGRKMVGATNPLKAEPGTIRGDYAQATGRCVLSHILFCFFDP